MASSPPDMSPTPEQLLAVADWLDVCVECEQVHEYRPLAGSYYNDKGEPVGTFTWAAPDGHAYFRRVYMLTDGTSSRVPSALRKVAAEISDS